MKDALLRGQQIDSLTQRETQTQANAEKLESASRRNLFARVTAVGEFTCPRQIIRPISAD